MATSTAKDVQRALRTHAEKKRAAFMPHFFKTGKGEYGEGDIFIGVAVPNTRHVVRQFRHIPLTETIKLLKSKVHEDRLAAVLLLNELYKRGDQSQRTKVYRAYLANTRSINNWDIIDSSAPYIVGEHLRTNPSVSRAVLDRMARSKLLWDRRIAILATQAFIKKDEFKDTLRIAQILLKDQHDLIQKAVGWMLREVGNRDQKAEEAFLRKYAARMPRTMLRYAIEKFPKAKRARYLLQ